MPLTLVLGPANSAKAGEVLGAYERAARRGAILVVPTALDASHYDRELSRHGTLLGQAMTFAGLSRELARRAGYAPRRLSALQRERVIRRIVARAELRSLAEAARAKGFATAAGQLIAELERSLVPPPRFASALRSWAGDDDGRVAYAHDVGSIYLAYVRELDRLGRVDRDLAAWRALDALRAEPRRWGDTPVFLYGFDDLTALERDAIETLARIAQADVMVSLTYEPGRPALSARAGVVEELRSLASSVRELPALDEHYDPGSREVLHHLERNLFEVSPPRLDENDAVVLLEGGGVRAEAELIASEVLRALGDGTPAGEIAIVCRSPARDGAGLARVLRAYGIPVAGERTVPLPHIPLGRSLLALARCQLDGPDAASAEDLLIYLRAPGLLQRPEVVDALEAKIRRLGLRTAAQARAHTTLSLGELDRRPDERSFADTLARHARRLLTAPHRGSAPVLGGEEELDVRAAAAVLDALAQLSDLEDAIPPRELLDLLDGVEVAAERRSGGDAVLIADPLAIRARRFRIVVVCGLCEGDFPLAGAIEPFLGDDRRHELALASGLALDPGEDALARERYLFYACISRATERVVLSYRSSDEDGNLVLPSPFLADVAELLAPEWLTRRRRKLLADVVWAVEDAPTPRELALTRAAAAVAPAAAARGAPVRTLSPAALERVRHREVVSGGALEAFAQCPVKWFVDRQLEPEPLALESEPLVRGSFMHQVLEGVVERLGGPVSSRSLPEAETLLSELAAEAPERLGAGRPDAIRRAVLRGIEADLRRYLEHEALDGCDWIPRGVEIRFGFEDGEESLPPLELRDGEERVLVRGMIDRVDIDPKRGGLAIVRDYKSGSSRPERAAARWRSEHQFQVALYMLAVRRLLGLDSVAGLYQPLGGRELRPRGAYVKDAAVGSRVFATDGLERPELDELLADIERQAVAVAAELRTGRLEPCPETCSRDGCRHPGICWAG